jgi:hypothetical protein
VVKDLYTVTWTSHAGRRWILEGDLRARRGVIFTGIDGMVGTVNRSSVDRSTGVGVVDTATTFGAMSGTLNVAVYPDGDAPLGRVHTEFVRGFDLTRPGVLEVVTAGREVWRAECVLSEPVGAPSVSPYAADLWEAGLSIPLYCSTGAWCSPWEVEASDSAGVHVTNTGDLPLFPYIEWAGAGKSFRVNGVRISLPTTTQPRFLSCDPGEGFVVRSGGPEGSVDVETWSAMRGLAVPFRVDPGEQVHVATDSGLKVHTRQRVLSPWR